MELGVDVFKTRTRMKQGDGLPRGGKNTGEPLLSTGAVVTDVVTASVPMGAVEVPCATGRSFKEMDDDQGGPTVIMSR